MTTPDTELPKVDDSHVDALANTDESDHVNDDEPVPTTPTPPPASADHEVSASHEVGDAHLRGLVEALVFASDRPLKAGEVGKLASAPTPQITKILEELRVEYNGRGIQLDEVRDNARLGL